MLFWTFEAKRFPSWCLPSPRLPFSWYIPRCAGKLRELLAPFASVLSRHPKESSRSCAGRGRWATWRSLDACRLLPGRTRQFQFVKLCRCLAGISRICPRSNGVYEAHFIIQGPEHHQHPVLLRHPLPSQQLGFDFCASVESNQNPRRRKMTRNRVHRWPCEHLSDHWNGQNLAASCWTCGRYG